MWKLRFKFYHLFSEETNPMLHIHSKKSHKYPVVSFSENIKCSGIDWKLSRHEYMFTAYYTCERSGPRNNHTNAKYSMLCSFHGVVGECSPIVARTVFLCTFVCMLQVHYYSNKVSNEQWIQETSLDWKNVHQILHHCISLCMKRTNERNYLCFLSFCQVSSKLAYCRSTVCWTYAQADFVFCFFFFRKWVQYFFIDSVVSILIWISKILSKW